MASGGLLALGIVLLLFGIFVTIISPGGVLLLLLGILFLILGAVLGGKPQPQVVYVQPQPIYVQQPAPQQYYPPPPPPAAPQVYLHCRYCGALNTPGNVHCTSCGATL